MLRASGLTRHFGTTVAFENVNLQINEGEVFGLLGPEGAGKTSVVRVLSTLLAPTAGEAWIGDLQVGVNEATNRLIRQQIGVLTASPGLYERLSAEQNLRLFAGLYGLRDGAKQTRRYLQLLDLWQERQAPVSSFSLEMKKKLALARALLHEPRVLLLDEPTTGLAPDAARAVWEAIIESCAERLTIFLCTPNLVEASYLCQRVGVFRQRLALVATPERLRQELLEPQITLRMRGRAGPYQHLLSELPFVRTVTLNENTLVAALTLGAEKHEAVAAMVRRLVEAGADLFDVSEAAQSLEDAYLELLEDTAVGVHSPAAVARPARATPPPIQQ